MVSYDSVVRFEPREGSFTTTCSASVGSGLRGSLLLLLVGGLQLPLCDALSCVHLHNEGFRRGLLSRRGPLVLPTPQGGHRSSLLFLSSGSAENLCHFHTLLLFTCSDDFLSLWSSSPASQCHSHCGRLRLRVFFLTLPPTLLNCARSRLSAE